MSATPQISSSTQTITVSTGSAYSISSSPVTTHPLSIPGSDQVFGAPGMSAGMAAVKPKGQTEYGKSLSLHELMHWSEKYINFLYNKPDGSPVTARGRKELARRLIAFLEQGEYSSCGVPELQAFFVTLRKKRGRYNRPLSVVSIASYYRNIKPMFHWFVAQGALRENPFLHIEKPRARMPQKEPLSEQVIDKLLEACAGSLHSARDEALLLFLLDTGCRNSEIRALRLCDVNLAGGFAEVLGKGNKKRQVYFTPFSAQKVERYLHATGRRITDSGLLFLNRKGEAFTKDGLCDIVKRRAAHAGVPSIANVHAFRRTFAVEMLRNKASAFSVQRALGHDDLKTTLIYSKIADSDVERQHRQCSPVLRLQSRSDKLVLEQC